LKILLSSHFFSPSIGGIESVSEVLATEFAGLGHTVKVITQTGESDGKERPYEVIRKPSARMKWELVWWCDVFFHNNISLQAAWPLAAVRRPWVIAHQTWMSPVGGKQTMAARLKHWLVRFATNVSISPPIAAALGVASVTVGNPYREEVFRKMDEVKRERDLVFLGRLVSDKGVDILIEAVAELSRNGLAARLTIIGKGPDEEGLRKLAAECGVGDLVRFAGPKSGEELARELNAHEVLVVPSRWEEPFGIVALEGIGCGCVVVGSDGGGLKAAMGPCGMAFESGNARGLAEALHTVLSRPEVREQLRSGAAGHLAQFSAKRVAAKYLEIFSAKLGGC